MDKPTVTIYTQVYNTEKYVRQCIESVLGQTFRDYEYIVVDNGCTDGSPEILREFAQKDARIKLIRNEKNRRNFSFSLMQEIAQGTFLTFLDSDDWWEPDYLERLLTFAERERLDIACTGTMMYVEATGAEQPRKAAQPVAFPKEMFPQGLPWYHAYLRAVWGKIIKTECVKAVPLAVIPALPYGVDTLWCFQVLRQAERMGIDDSVLHHYRIRKTSVSRQYDPKRFESDVYLYNDAVDFLSAYGPVSARNRNFLQAVYSNAIVDTTNVIHGSSLAPADRLREYRAIATHPLTQKAYRECTNESAGRSRNQLVQLALLTRGTWSAGDDTDFQVIMRALLPRCGRALTGKNLPLFVQDQALLQALLEDNAGQLLERLLALIAGSGSVKQYDLPGTVKALAADTLLLCQIEDTAFLRKYGALYLMVWRGETLPALDEMTGLLLEDQVTGGKETFLQLYISLAAVEEQSPAFLYGKLQLARLYLSQGKRSECRIIVDELAEMGLEHEELSRLRQELEEPT